MRVTWPRWLIIVAAAAVTILAVKGAIYGISMIAGPVVIAAGSGPGVVTVSRNGRFLYVADYGDGSSIGRTVTVIDLKNGDASRSIKVGKYPTEMAVTPNGRVLYVLVDSPAITGLYTGMVVRVDPLTESVSRPLRFKGGADGIALSPDGRTLYVAAGSRHASVIPINVADGTSGKPITLRQIPLSIAVGPAGKTLYAVYGFPEGRHADKIIPVDIRTGRQGKTISLGNTPEGLAFAPGGRVLYVVASDDEHPVGRGPESLITVNLATGREESSIPLGPTPEGVAVSVTGHVVFVQGNNNVIDVISPDTGKVIASLHAAGIFNSAQSEIGGLGAPTLVLSPDGRTLYAATGTSVAVIPVSGFTG